MAQDRPSEPQRLDDPNQQVVRPDASRPADEGQGASQREAEAERDERQREAQRSPEERQLEKQRAADEAREAETADQPPAGED